MVRLPAALRCAAGETVVLATGERRWVWAAARSWSLNRVGRVPGAGAIRGGRRGEQEPEDVGADPIRAPMVDEAHLEIDGLAAAKSAFDGGEGLIGAYRGFGIECVVGTRVRNT